MFLSLHHSSLNLLYGLHSLFLSSSDFSSDLSDDLSSLSLSPTLFQILLSSGTVFGVSASMNSGRLTRPFCLSRFNLRNMHSSST